METDDFKGIRLTGAQTSSVRSLRCPHCSKVSAFHGLENVHDLGWMTVRKNQVGQPSQKDGYRAGVRICPNPDCRSIILIAFHVGDNSNIVYPFETIEFDINGIPAEIVKSFREALTCHGTSCFRACALMVRRTLEEICEDQGIGGKNLKERLAALGSKIVIPKELIDAADELRLLGNDAAHIESKDYASIGAKEVEISIMFVKEILKATYQYASLLSELRALKKP